MKVKVTFCENFLLISKLFINIFHHQLIFEYSLKSESNIRIMKLLLPLLHTATTILEHHKWNFICMYKIDGKLIFDCNLLEEHRLWMTSSSQPIYLDSIFLGKEFQFPRYIEGNVPHVHETHRRGFQGKSSFEKVL